MGWVGMERRMVCMAMGIAAYTTYFSIASASACNVSNGRVGREGCGPRYMYCNRREMIGAGSVISTSECSDILTLDEDGDGEVTSAASANTCECISRFARCTLNNTSSEDCNVISESSKQSAISNSALQLLKARESKEHDLQSSETYTGSTKVVVSSESGMVGGNKEEMRSSGHHAAFSLMMR